MLPKFGADGIFLDETLKGVKAFQQQAPSLKDDGIVGDLTLGGLRKEMTKLPTWGRRFFNFSGTGCVPPAKEFNIVLEVAPVAGVSLPFFGLVGIPAPTAIHWSFDSIWVPGNKECCL